MDFAVNILRVYFETRVSRIQDKMKYVGMPAGMWLLFAGSFEKNIVSVLGHIFGRSKGNETAGQEEI